MARFDFRITRDDSFERSIAGLYAAGAGGLRGELEREIRKEAAPTVRAVRAAVRAVNITAAKPAKGRKRPGLRRGRGLRSTIANAVQVSTRNTTAAGVRIELAMGRIPAEMRALPALVDGRGRWRHPVFGHSRQTKKGPQSNPWVQQYGQAWFVPTILRHAPQFRAGVQRAMDRVANRIS